jgi:hypothetical protein
MSPKARTVRLRANPALEDMLKHWALSEGPNVGWCLFCDPPMGI